MTANLTYSNGAVQIRVGLELANLWSDLFPKFPSLCLQFPCLRNTLSTAGNSVTSSERPSPEPLLKKEASPGVLSGREFWIHALEASNALNHRAWGIPAVLSRGKSQETI